MRRHGEVYEYDNYPIPSRPLAPHPDRERIRAELLAEAKRLAQEANKRIENERKR